MAKNNLHLLAIMIFGVLLSGACSINTETPSQNNQDNAQKTQCISSQMFSYPIKQDEVVATPQIQPALPLSPWKQVISLPAFPVNVQGIDIVQIAMHHNESDKIWVIRQLSSNEQSTPDHRQLLTYQPETEKWEMVIDQTQSSEFIPDVIFRSKDEKIWGLKNGAQGSNTPILSLYNEKKRTFEFVEDSNGFLKGDFFGFSNHRPPLIDQNGVFWMVRFDGLYSFDPIIYASQQYLIDYDEVDSYLSTSYAIAKNGNIFVLLENAKELIQFVQSDTKIDRIKVQLNLPKSSEIPDGVQANSIFIDSLDRIWVNDYGWMQQNGSWHQIISRFPGFFSVPNEIPYFHWELPLINLESSDGHLWFSSSSGMVSLAPDKGEWCWFTTYQSNIVEDADNNLWMIADGKLYKYPSQP